MQILIESISSVKEEELQEKPLYVTEERWEKIKTIKPIDDKKRSLLAGKLLSRMCEELEIDNPTYGATQKGKPVLVSHPDVAFNLSHSGEYVVLVYEKGIPSIGVDIQEIRKISESLKRRLLHEEECIPEALSQEERNVLLNRIWAIKESYVKMTGEGLSHDFRKLRVEFENKTVTDENGKNAYFEEYEAPEGYVMAVTGK